MRVDETSQRPEMHAARRAGARWLGSCALLALSCSKFASELDELDGEPAELRSVAALGPDSGDWSCVRSTGASLSGASSTRGQDASDTTAPDGALTFRLSAADFVTAAPVAQLAVRACYRADVACESPVSEGVPDADGLVQITADTGFNGYLEVTGADMLPSLLFFPAPWSPELLAELEQRPVLMLPARALQALGESARIQLDAAAGVVGVYAYDCGGAVAPGVRLELDIGAVPYAFVDGLPVANQDVTSDQGLAGFVNVPPGVVVVSSYAGAQPEAMSVESLLVRSGWVSSMSLLPSYAP